MKNEGAIRDRIYSPVPVRRETTLPVGSWVLISTKKNIFEKGYKYTHQPMIYRISKQLDTTPITYELENQNGQKIKGGFYKEEIQVVSEKLKTWPIERILAERVRNGHKEVLIKWKNFPDSFNTWQSLESVFASDDG